jgi:hypothetical protein
MQGVFERPRMRVQCDNAFAVATCRIPRALANSDGCSWRRYACASDSYPFRSSSRMAHHWWNVCRRSNQFTFAIICKRKALRKTFARNLQAVRSYTPTALAAGSGRTGLAFLHGVGSRLTKESPRSRSVGHSSGDTGGSEMKAYKTGKLSSMSNRLFHRRSIYVLRRTDICTIPHL